MLGDVKLSLNFRPIELIIVNLVCAGL
jgi:hypothetical protein